MADHELVRRSDQEAVAVLEFNRPERRNALTGPVFDQLADHLDVIADDSGVGAVLLCGAGGSFSSGLDLKEYNADPPPPWMATSRESARRAHLALAQCQAPIVVALERYAINGAAAFALAGDLIVVGEEAWLQVGEVQQALPAPMNLAWLVARHPMSTVLQIVLTGERFYGPTLERMNIAHEVVDDAAVRSRAGELAVQVAGYPAQAARNLKQAALALSGGMLDADWFERAARVSPVPGGGEFRPGHV